MSSRVSWRVRVRVHAAAVALCVLVAGPACRRHESGSAAPEPRPAEAQPNDGAIASYDGTPAPAEREPEPKAKAKPEPKAKPKAEPAKPRPPHTIFRSEIERALAGGPGHLLYQLGPEPFRVEGKFIGWEITRLFPDDPDLCDPCDLAIGDVILAINGDRLETPQAFASMVEKAATLRSLEVRSLRDEQRRIVSYTIVDD